jgi:hypothetical protein
VTQGLRIPDFWMRLWTLRWGICPLHRKASIHIGRHTHTHAHTHTHTHTRNIDTPTFNHTRQPKHTAHNICIFYVRPPVVPSNNYYINSQHKCVLFGIVLLQSNLGMRSLLRYCLLKMCALQFSIYLCNWVFAFVGTFVKLRKATIIFVMSVRPYVYPSLR